MALKCQNFNTNTINLPIVHLARKENSGISAGEAVECCGEKKIIESFGGRRERGVQKRHYFLFILGLLY